MEVKELTKQKRRNTEIKRGRNEERRREKRKEKRKDMKNLAKKGC